MKTRTILSIIALILGEAVIVGGFFLWRCEDTPDSIFALNIIVSSIVYALCFVDVLFPWINRRDSSGRQVGSLGLRWTVSTLYTLLAIAAMLLLNKVFGAIFLVQLIVHVILLFLLVLGFTAVLHSSDKVASVHAGQAVRRQGVTDMATAVAGLEEDLLDYPDVPQELMDMVRNMKDDIRYVSPSDNPEAGNLEQQFVDRIESVTGWIHDFDRNRAEVEKAVIAAGRILRRRKDMYSN